jgi:DNA topoisomerase IA
MSKALIIAEKPSVANDIARALGGFTKHDEYYESDDYVLSSAVGHLLEIAASGVSPICPSFRRISTSIRSPRASRA